MVSEFVNTPNEQLMEKVKTGDEEAFYILVKRYERPLFNFIFRMVEDYPLAEDLYQETFLHLYQSRARYDPAKKFSTWLYSIAAHLCLDKLRWRKRIRFFSLETKMGRKEKSLCLGDILPSAVCEPEVQLEKKEWAMEVQRALKSLSKEHRLVFIMRHYQGLSYQEISEILNCPVGTVKSRMHYALEHLKSKLT